MRTLKALMNLSGRRALITGGAGAIARAVAESLLEMGAGVALVDYDLECCRKRATELGPMAKGYACDLTSESATRAMVSEVVSDLGGLDIFVHCAAFVGSTKFSGWAVPFASQIVQAWNAAMAVNVTAPFVIAQEARNALAADRGSIILFSSIYGMVAPDFSLYEGTGMANPAGYGASKGGVLQLTRYLSTSMAPMVRVNAISPGGVWRNQPEAFHEKYKAKTPLGRMAVEEDLKGAVAYLASDLSAYVTGQNLVVDGGWTVW